MYYYDVMVIVYFIDVYCNLISIKLPSLHGVNSYSPYICYNTLYYVCDQYLGHDGYFSSTKIEIELVILYLFYRSSYFKFNKESCDFCEIVYIC